MYDSATNTHAKNEKEKQRTTNKQKPQQKTLVNKQANKFE
jgi:hypothetical protein